ncbi:MAG: holo-ACP synthase [Alphaproteobacteria bacterium]|nr:holo-ACP synthase [Alphaproteobacteria bacterium]
MIIGIGVDLVDMRRIDRLIQRFGTHFIQKVYTKEELTYATTSAHPLRAYANRFAAKEAAAKALGTGMRQGISWQDIEILRSSAGAPSLYFHHRALEVLQSRLPQGTIGCAHVSFSDEPPYSTAFVVLSAISIEEGYS